ncbi:MAG: cation transporter, partial [Pseudomonadota bacterium]
MKLLLGLLIILSTQSLLAKSHSETHGNHNKAHFHKDHKHDKGHKHDKDHEMEAGLQAISATQALV